MATISDIKQQTKRANRYSVYIDGAYAFSLSESQVLSLGIYRGQELTADEIKDFQQDSNTGKLFDRVLNLYSYRMRTEWEVRDYLRRKNATDKQVSEIITKCQKLGYVNDQRFAETWVANRRLGKPTSQRKLRSELAAKRVDSSIIDSVLAEDRSQTDEREVLTALIAKKQHRYADKTKFMQYLARQGFSYDDIKSALAAQIQD